jgi:KipI family sensor histidine kinase inhibitor
MSDTRWISLGDRAIRFVRPRSVSARAILSAARTWPGAIDVVVTRDDVAVYFDREPLITPALVDALSLAEDTELSSPKYRSHLLHATYDGVDLAHIATTVGISIEDIIEMHQRATYVVDMIGFAPGFAYLVGLDPRLAAIPRRESPRTRVPAGSIAIAGGYTAVYPFDSPGGWHIIGRVDAQMFTTDGARLQLGDRVRFVR